MKIIKLFSSAMFLTGLLGLSPVTLWAQQGVIYKAQGNPGNYCHMKFPAIREETLGSDRPVLKDAGSGDIIDFYGPCDYDPLGKDSVRRQRLERQLRFSREYSD